MKLIALLSIAAAVIVSAAAYIADVDTTAPDSVRAVKRGAASIPQLQKSLAAAEDRLRAAEDARDDAKDRVNELNKRKKHYKRVPRDFKKQLHAAAQRLRAAEDARDDAKDALNAIKKGLESLLKRERERGACLLYTSPSPRDKRQSRMPSSA